MNLEEAKLFGNRHLTGNTKFAIDTHCSKPRIVRITASREVAETVAGQHCLWMLTNLLARQFGIITELTIDIPAVPVVLGVDLFGTGKTLRETLINTASLVAGSALDVCEYRSAKQIDADAGVGRYQPLAPFSISVLADGWRIFAGKPNTVPAAAPVSDNPFGPYFGACVVAGEIFKHLALLRPGCGRIVNQLAFSLWDYERSDSWDAANLGSWPDRILLPPFYLVGAGAVGQAAAASLAACPRIGGYMTTVDDEMVDKTNRNRYSLAHTGNLGQKKALIVAEVLRRANFHVVPYDRKWEAYVQGIDRPEQRSDVAELERQWKFRRVLSCVDKNGSRHSIQNIWPELILGGSTLECGILVQAYDLKTDGECLKCSNPIEEDLPTIEGEAAKWKKMTADERRLIATKAGLNLNAIEDYLSQPKCGTLGEKEIAKFVLDPRHDWSVGFVSVASGVLLAAKLVQLEIAGVEAAFPPLRGQALRFSFLNPGPFITRHPRKDSCDCFSKGKSCYHRLWE